MTDANHDGELIGFIASTVENIRDRVDSIEQRMVTKEDLARLEGRFDEKLGHLEGRFDEKLARLEGRFDERLARLEGRFDERLTVLSTSIRGDIEQVQLRLDSMDHSISSRFEHVEGELSRLRSAVYLLGKDHPDVLRLLGRANS